MPAAGVRVRAGVGGLLVASSTMLLVATVACSGDTVGRGGAGGDEVAEAGFVSGDGRVTTFPVDERKPAPAMEGEDLDGEPIALDDFAGEVVVLNVWGSWCPPCRKETPDLVELADVTAGDGIVVVGVNTRDNDPLPARRFVETFDVPYRSFYDPDGRLLLGLRDTVPATAIPSTLIIDRQGRIAARVIGESTRRTFEELAREVAAEDGS